VTVTAAVVMEEATAAAPAAVALGVSVGPPGGPVRGEADGGEEDRGGGEEDLGTGVALGEGVLACCARTQS